MTSHIYKFLPSKLFLNYNTSVHIPNLFSKLSKAICDRRTKHENFYLVFTNKEFLLIF